MNTVPAPSTDAATIQELSFLGPYYHIKNAKKWVLAWKVMGNGHELRASVNGAGTVVEKTVNTPST